ncbi:hypothetical protein HanRHA438_Chr08g0354771 [Helianthus annuus]|uniref:Uncharacterized protein n=1 Tax=Helianthus annuus TaxID=4232 RepID=A0A251SHC4_HELAN|nr:hypothetical protein HanXRQr2_Chr08g0343301 [Helianthus annuus]KAJ0539208.1 hypothetical protein HanHA300_Chr08g0283731 [Helianthus annuus]KAJ0547300.1 hypothetical protein HanIR_Chr08g0370641 [Helianthus annuus]KAJ0553858.1 hypothetical protein HanHA89_Chr08g0301121 [Helianthus annuus]KAJ0722742.1 hypothetical protein HanOQP8_Chr08g0290111 [Helianthus annuus]
MWHVFRGSHNSFWRETSRVVIWDAEHVNSGHHMIKTDPLYNFANPNFLSRRSPTLSPYSALLCLLFHSSTI